MREKFLRIATLLYGCFAVLPAALNTLLFFCARTVEGRLFSLTAYLWLLVPLLALRVCKQRGRAVWFLLFVSVSALLLTLLLYQRTPSVPHRAFPHAQSVWLDGGYRRASLASLLPERDQLTLGSYVMVLLDPLLTRQSAARLRALADAQYERVERSVLLRGLATPMHQVLLDAPSGHVYVLNPTERGAGSAAVIFLHGSGGNFSSYLPVWERVARECSLVVLAPSFGFGNWHHAGGTEAIERARAYALRELRVDPARIYLAGLSNGGRGVTRALLRAPYAGVIFMSAVIEASVLASARERWRGMPVLLLHGEQDERIPMDYVRSMVDVLQEYETALTVHTEQREDHYLIWSEEAPVAPRICRWLTSVQQ